MKNTSNEPKEDAQKPNNFKEKLELVEQSLGLASKFIFLLGWTLLLPYFYKIEYFPLELDLSSGVVFILLGVIFSLTFTIFILLLFFLIDHLGKSSGEYKLCLRIILSVLSIAMMVAPFWPQIKPISPLLFSALILHGYFEASTKAKTLEDKSWLAFAGMALLLMYSYFAAPLAMKILGVYTESATIYFPEKYRKILEVNKIPLEVYTESDKKYFCYSAEILLDGIGENTVAKIKFKNKATKPKQIVIPSSGVIIVETEEENGNENNCTWSSSASSVVNTGSGLVQKATEHR